MRFVLCPIGFVTILILFANTPLSFVARPIFVTYALLFFAVGVLDINAVVNGYVACQSNFANTDMHDVIVANQITVSCQQGSYAMVCAFDMILSAQLFFIYTAWMFCKDKYVRKANDHTSDQRALLNTSSNV
jgi:hypothetical protein